MKFKLLIAIVGAALFAGACTSASNNAANSNRSNGMTNIAASNTNTAAVVTNSNANSPYVSTNANKWNPNITREEYEKNKGEYEKEKGSSTIGTGANDMWLWVKTRASLMGADDLRDSTINVDVENDVVTLKGTVASAAQKTKAEQVAKSVSGVKSVKNQLTVSASGSTTGNSNTNKK
jgi:hypothetical protein